MTSKAINFILISSFLLIFSSITAQQSAKKLVQPPYLQKGDTVVMLAPAGALPGKKEILDKATQLAKNWGLIVVYSKNLLNNSHHFSGTDAERTADFQKALDNPNVKAIWAGRGGYGTVRILDKLDFTKFKIAPKWIIGYSDITALHNHVHNLGYETMHAMMGVNLSNKQEDIAETIASFKRAIFGKKLKYQVDPSEYNRVGKAKGQLVGGNLSLIVSMLGSKSAISTDGKILFIEDVGEQNYSIDRMLQTLKRAGYFTHLKALVVGDFSSVKPNVPYWGTTTQQLVLDVVKEYDFPILFGFPAGHKKDNRALILGRKVKLNVCKDKKSTLVFTK